MNTVGIILSAGKGTRMGFTNKNKTAVELFKKPLVQYGVELYNQVVDKIVVVVGAHSESVRQSLSDQAVVYVTQDKQLGTGHAAQVAFNYLNEQKNTPEYVFVGYGDHMMLYQHQTLKHMLETLHNPQVGMVLVSTIYHDPNYLAWGRVIRDMHGYVMRVVEQKDATPAQRTIQESNAGFYCFKYQFLKQAINQLKPSVVTGEYYITDLVEIANTLGASVTAIQVPFSEVGTGINTPEQLAHTARMMHPHQTTGE